MKYALQAIFERFVGVSTIKAYLLRQWKGRKWWIVLSNCPLSLYFPSYNSLYEPREGDIAVYTKKMDCLGFLPISRTARIVHFFVPVMTPGIKTILHNNFRTPVYYHTVAIQKALAL